TKSLMAMIGVLLAVPAVAYIWAPLRRRSVTEGSEEGFADACAIADLPVGQWRPVRVGHWRPGRRAQKGGHPNALRGGAAGGAGRGRDGLFGHLPGVGLANRTGCGKSRVCVPLSQGSLYG